MWLLEVLFLVAGSTIALGAILDVTTVYNLKPPPSRIRHSIEIPGRVYVQTNALGLPIRSGDGEILLESSYSRRLNLTCDLIRKNGCSWDINNGGWSIKHMSKEIAPGKMYEVGSETISLGFNIPHYMDGPLYIYVEHSPSSASNVLLSLYLPSNYNSGSFYISSECARICCQSHSQILAYRNERLEVSCNKQQQLRNIESNDYISFNVRQSQFHLYSGVEHLASINLMQDVNTMSFMLYGPPNIDIFTQLIVRPVLTTSTPESKLVSPIIMVDESEMLCLNIILYGGSLEANTYSEFQKVFSRLELLVEDLQLFQHVLTEISFEEGWSIKQVKMNIDKNIPRPFKLIIKNNGINSSIAGIYPCDPEGLEVFKTEPVLKEALLNYNSNKWKSNPSYIYKASLNMQGLENVTPNVTTFQCQNGGVWTSHGGCACPPGFSGKQCQKGCGPNRFGLDCGSSCSLRSAQCMYKLLCNYETGCHCAPGYYGESCQDECSDRKYGNDCKQICGHCRYGNGCDIYTGECQECEPGYTLPFCKEAYVYYASRPDLSSTEYGSITVKFTQDFAGFGDPVIYQIQFKNISTPYITQFGEWHIFISKEIPKRETVHEEEEGLYGIRDPMIEKNSIQEDIKGLNTGYLYAVRIILMDTNFNKYDGDLIQTAEIVTKCDMPGVNDFKITTETTLSTITLTWSYTNATEHGCPIIDYEVAWKEDGEWKKLSTMDLQFMLSDLLPNTPVPFVIRPNTHAGYGPSIKLVATTNNKGPSRVRDLRVVSSQSTSVVVSWNPPQDGNGRLLYTIQYECVEQPACSSGCTNTTEASLTQDQTSVTLTPLLPFAQYRVTVNPEDGPGTTIFAGTAKTVPNEVPLLASQGILRSNTSLTVFWEPPTICTSFLIGYNYRLYKHSDLNKIMGDSFTKSTNATFHNLTASTGYIVRVFVVTTAGWNPDAYMDFNTSTTATVPEVVRNLTVYKRSRSSLGVRWAAPGAMYGTLKAFTVAYSQGSEAGSYVVDPSPCVPWPQLYCYTLQSLWPNRKYTVTVSARNSEVAEDGAKTSVVGTTKENPPSAPEGLLLTNCTDTSISVEWRYPELANGIIRSFLISVEETEQFDQDSCCQIFPLIESPVQEEQLNYKAEVPNLHPASTYFVSVSAKTVGLGPAQSLVVQTKPPHLPFLVLPQLEGKEDEWLPPLVLPLRSNNSDVYKPLIKAHIILLVDDAVSAEINSSGVINPQINHLLQEAIGKPFYFYTEYNQENKWVSLSSLPDEGNSSWGARPTPYLTNKSSYQIVAAQISQYGSEFNVDIRHYPESQTLYFL